MAKNKLRITFEANILKALVASLEERTNIPQIYDDMVLNEELGDKRLLRRYPIQKFAQNEDQKILRNTI